MKRIMIRSSNQNHHKILEGESQKLKEKLDSLKKQIEQKKREKQMAKGGKQIQSRLEKNKTDFDNIDTNNQLQELLASLKLELIAAKLKDRGITTCEHFNQITGDELDKWKDIAVGYRIKIRKYIENGKKELLGESRKSNDSKGLANSRRSSLPASPDKKNNHTLNIQDIVKNRKQQQVYVPIDRKDEEINQDQELGQDEQDIMIHQLMKTFRKQWRKQGESPSSKLQEEQAEQYYYNEEEDIQQIRYQKPVQYVKILKPQVESHTQNFPNYKYCWSCLKMIKETDNFGYRSRQFCSETCLQRYQNVAEIDQKASFFQQIQQIEQQFDQHLTQKSNKKQKSAKKEPIQIDTELAEQFEQRVDLSLM